MSIHAGKYTNPTDPMGSTKSFVWLYTLANQHGNVNSACLMGDTSSNGCFFHCRVSFLGYKTYWYSPQIKWCASGDLLWYRDSNLLNYPLSLRRLLLNNFKLILRWTVDSSRWRLRGTPGRDLPNPREKKTEKPRFVFLMNRFWGLFLRHLIYGSCIPMPLWNRQIWICSRFGFQVHYLSSFFTLSVCSWETIGLFAVHSETHPSLKYP